MESTISALEGLAHLGSTDWAAIDVRSEGEFQQGHLPGFASAPILRDAERREVGIEYKKRGQEAAIRLGHALVAPEREARISRWLELARGRPALVACWRGGLRSEIASGWMAEAGASVLRIQGGYRAMRAELLPRFESPGELWVLSGYTGSGKTELIRSMPPHWSVDLEEMARHRGSSFGRIAGEEQPRQATFENRLGLKLHLEPHAHLVEDESLRIGGVALPVAFRQRMHESPLILLEEDVRNRSLRIFREYVAEPLEQGVGPARLLADLQASTRALARRLGGALLAEIVDGLERAFSAPAGAADPEAHRGWIETLLIRHYDRLYRHSIEQSGRKVAFRGSRKECKEWIGERFASLRP